MTHSMKLVAIGLMAGSAAFPAASQYYPQPPYPQQGYPQQYPQRLSAAGLPAAISPISADLSEPGYPNQGYPYANQQPYSVTENAIVGIVNSLIGTRYPAGDRQAIQQCSWAAVQRAQAAGPAPYGGYGGGYPGGGYPHPYSGYSVAPIRLTAITNVEHRANSVRVRGLLDTGLYGVHAQGYGGQGYGGQGYGGGAYGYGNGPYNGGGDTAFRCDVDYRGAVFNVRLDRVGRPY